MIDFLATWVALYGAHDVADYWVQRPCDAMGKGSPGWRGRIHCLTHVATYGVTQGVALGLLGALYGLDLDAVPFLAGMALNLGTHYFADRRTPLRQLASLLPGKRDYWDNGGAPNLDQAWHKGWIFVSALVIAI